MVGLPQVLLKCRSWNQIAITDVQPELVPGFQKYLSKLIGYIMRVILVCEVYARILTEAHSTSANALLELFLTAITSPALQEKNSHRDTAKIEVA